MRVLIVKVSALGDIVHALPILDYLHRTAPGVQIDWVVEDQNRTILEGHPLISRLICVNTRQWCSSPLSGENRQKIASVVRSLKTESYDAVFDVQGNIKSGVIAWLSGAAQRYGFAGDGVREMLNLLFTNRHIPLRPEDRHVSCRSLRVVSAPFGGEFNLADLCTDIFTSADDEQVAAQITAPLPAGPRIIFHNGTSWPTKLWYDEAWVELGRLVLGGFPDASVLLSWGNLEELTVAEKIRDGIGASATVLPRLSLKQLCALMKSVHLVVGGDTGPVHIAAAVGTPTVSFYRATDPLRNGPAGLKHQHIQTGMRCRECLRKKCDMDEECRRGIAPDALFELVERVLR